MGIREIFGALGRRWMLVLIGIVLTVGAGWQIYQTNPPEYTAKSLVLFLPPVGSPTAEEEGGANPFLELAGLDLTARVVVATYSSTAFEEELAKVSEFAEVAVNIDDSTRGGIIAVDVKDRTAEQALGTLAYVTDSVSERLTNLQEDVGVEDVDAVRSMILAADTEAKPDYQSLIRILVIVLGGGLGVTIALTLAIDMFIVRRRRRRGMFEYSSAGGRSKHATGSPDDGDPAATELPDALPLPELEEEPVAASANRLAPASAPSRPRPAAQHNVVP